MRPAILLAAAVLLVVPHVIPGGVRALDAGSVSVQFFRLDPGTPSQSQTVFVIPIFVLGEPAGSPVNRSETQQAWQDLTVAYLNASPGPFPYWSVPSWGPGRFDLRLSLTPTEVRTIEGGQALLALNSSVVVGNSTFGAAGLIDGPVLSSAVVLGAWWNDLFDIQTPPPDTNPSTFTEVIADLAWFGGSAAGRALYAVVTLVAVLVYLLEAQKIAKRRLAGIPTEERR